MQDEITAAIDGPVDLMSTEALKAPNLGRFSLLFIKNNYQQSVKTQPSLETHDRAHGRKHRSRHQIAADAGKDRTMYRYW
jgi:hypothetical protein